MSAGARTHRSRAWRLLAGAALCVLTSRAAAAQTADATPTQPGIAESPTITVLKGLMVPQFEVEMRHFVQALGVGCGGCHVRGSFTSEANPRKAVARRMIEMTKSLNQRFFPGFTPPEGESSLGRVTCFTCHQGATDVKAAPAPSLPGR